MPKSNPALRPAPANTPEPPPTVSARWLLSAVLLTLVAAALCGYATLGLLFYQGQWQLLFHPSRTLAATPSTAGLRYDDVRFDVTDTGQPRLDGWWIPAGPGAQYVTATVLYLHGARGSLSGTVPALATLHSLGINVFAFDYQGFGLSAGRHPTERLANAGSAAAWSYLTDIRHIPPKNLIVFGDGAGAAFAVHLAARFPPAGVILEDPGPTARQVFAADARARILPLWLLQKEYLDPARDLPRLHAPLLFLDRSGNSARTRALYNAAPYPKQIAALRSAPPATVAEALRRFLDQLLP
jgi:uncharacterized protein